MFTKKIYRKKKLEKNLKNYFGIFFIFKKKSVGTLLIVEKKIEKNFENSFCNFFIFKKKSVNSSIKG